MKKICFVGLALTAILAGCSKHEDKSPTPQSAQSQPAEKAAPNTPLPVKGADMAQAAIDAATNKAVVSAASAFASVTNAAAASALASMTNAAAVTGTLSGLGIGAPASPQTSVPIASTANTPPPNAASPLSLASFSTDQLSQGLKEALSSGIQYAVASLGQPGGFLTNVAVKIPLPEKLQPVEKGLRAIGQGQFADQCINTMNQAAEQAVPVAADVFVGALKNMTVDDAKTILSGPPDAATKFFRRNTEAELTKKFAPIIQQAMTKCGTTAAYETVLDKAKGAMPFFNTPSLDLNAYVTSKAMDGLFTTVAVEEKRIRESPGARSTDLLKSVFGALQK